MDRQSIALPTELIPRIRLSLHLAESAGREPPCPYRSHVLLPCAVGSARLGLSFVTTRSWLVSTDSNREGRNANRFTVCPGYHYRTRHQKMERHERIRTLDLKCGALLLYQLS